VSTTARDSLKCAAGIERMELRGHSKLTNEVNWIVFVISRCMHI
jgi:hypothetical protein